MNTFVVDFRIAQTDATWRALAELSSHAVTVEGKDVHQYVVAQISSSSSSSCLLPHPHSRCSQIVPMLRMYGRNMNDRCVCASRLWYDPLIRIAFAGKEPADADLWPLYEFVRRSRAACLSHGLLRTACPLAVNLFFRWCV